MVEEEERREVSIHLYRPYLASSDFALAGCLALDLLAQLVLHSTAESCKRLHVCVRSVGDGKQLRRRAADMAAELQLVLINIDRTVNRNLYMLYRCSSGAALRTVSPQRQPVYTGYGRTT